MVNGSIIVVEILKETIEFDHQTRNILVLDSFLREKGGGYVPYTLCNIKMVNKEIIQQVAQFQVFQFVHLQNHAYNVVANDFIGNKWWMHG